VLTIEVSDSLDSNTPFDESLVNYSKSIEIKPMEVNIEFG